jgi:hypothetical protein
MLLDHVQEIIEQFFEGRFAYLLLSYVLLKKTEGQDRYLRQPKKCAKEQTNKQTKTQKSCKEIQNTKINTER